MTPRATNKRSPCDIGTASRLLIAIPEGFEAGAIAKKVRELNANRIGQLVRITGQVRHD